MDRTRCRNDDDEDQHSAVLWLSLRKVEVKELELRERETEKHSLRECPQNIQFSNCKPVFLLCCTPTVATLWL